MMKHYILLIVSILSYTNAFLPELDSKISERLGSLLLKHADIDNSTKEILDIVTNPITYLEDGLTEVSEECQKDVLRYTSSLNYEEPLNVKSWALKMFDATGKVLPGSSLQGAFVDMPGNVDSCLEIDNGNFLGEYCLTMVYIPQQAPPPGLKVEKPGMELDPNMILQILRPSTNIVVWQNPLKLGLCIPNSCSSTDVYSIYKNIFTNMTIQDQVVHYTECKDKNTSEQFTDADFVAIAIFTVIGLIVIIGTIIDVAVYHFDDTWISSKLLVSLQGFSAHHVIRKIFHVTENKDGLGCINGIRFWSMVWVIVGHTYMRFYFEATPFRNNTLPSLQDILTSTSLRLVSNATPSVDSFFLIGALLLSYLTMKEVTKLRGGNIKFWSLFYIHRYIRLTGALAGVILFYTTLMKFMPYKSMSLFNAEHQACQDSWWKNLLYFNNFEGLDCMGHTWYMANDMQMFIITPIIFVSMYLSPIIGNLFTACLVLGSIGWRLALELEHYGDDEYDTFKGIYAKPWTRFAPYGIGLIVGNILFHLKGKWSCIATKTLQDRVPSGASLRMSVEM